MEYKWNIQGGLWKQAQMGLNPCFNGIQMELTLEPWYIHIAAGLNPCFNGIQMEPLI